jgi:hypothetical protein
MCASEKKASQITVRVSRKFFGSLKNSKDSEKILRVSKNFVYFPKNCARV